MTLDARPATLRRHPSHEQEQQDESERTSSTEGASSLLADDANELPADAEDLELPPDIEVQSLGDGVFEDEVTLDDLEVDRGDPEVEDTPGDDAMIAAARIARFDDAHDNAQPVDVGPWDEGNRRGTTDDARIASARDPSTRGKPPVDDEVDEQAGVEDTTLVTKR